MPAMFSHCWQWFIELHRARGSNGFGYNPLGFQDIDAWSRLTQRNISRHEVYAIVQIDSAFLTVQAQQTKKREKRK